MSAKRLPVNLMELTAEQATPMPEAEQRKAASPKPAASKRKSGARSEPAVPTADLEALAFKVPPSFRKRFKQRAVMADLKQNELLFAALADWEEKQGLKS